MILNSPQTCTTLLPETQRNLSPPPTFVPWIPEHLVLVSQLQETGVRGSPILSLLASSVLAWSGAIRNTDPKGWRKDLAPANRSGGDPLAKEDHLSPQTLRQCPSSPREAHRPGVRDLLLTSAPSGNISLTLRKEEWHSLFLSTLLSIPRPPGEKKVCVWH